MKQQQSQLKAAVMILAAAILIVIPSLFIPANIGMIVISFCCLLGIIGTALLLWSSRNDLIQLCRYLGSVLFSAYLTWLGINYLDRLSLERHDSIGPGGGFSIAVGIIFSSFQMCLLLLILFANTQLMQPSNHRIYRVVASAPYALMLLWPIMLMLLGRNI